MAWFTLSIDLDEIASEDEAAAQHEPAAQHELDHNDEVC